MQQGHFSQKRTRIESGFETRLFLPFIVDHDKSTLINNHIYEIFSVTSLHWKNLTGPNGG